MMSLSEIWRYEFLGNSARAWTLALAAFLVTFTVLPLLRRMLLAQRAKWGASRMPGWVDLALLLIAHTRSLFLWAVAVYVGTRFLELGPRVARASDILIILIVWLQVGLWGSAAARFVLDRERVKQGLADTAIGGSFDIILFLARTLIFAIVLLLALANLGIDITALVAGLGIGGIAVALAVQTVLGDLLASLSIALDKPFAVGDSLRIDDYEGTVEHVGIKSTRLRSVSGEQIILSNADVLKSRVRNLGRMPERRTLFTLGVAYETSEALLKRIPELVREAVSAYPEARFEHCHFRSFGESALVFEVCYFVRGAGTAAYAEVLDGVNLRIHGAFEREGLRFAYPTRTLYTRPAS